MSSEPRDPDPPDVSETPDCPRAHEALNRFVTGGVTVEEERWLRAHLVICEPCRDRYRESVRSAAALGGARRRERIEETRLRRQEAMRRRALAVGGQRSRGRFFGLRVVALVTAVILVLTWLNPSWNTPQFEVIWESGDVRAAGTLLHEGLPESKLVMGDWCLTDVASSARIDTPGGELWLGHDTQLLVEDPKRGRVRLQRGLLEVTGSSVVSSQYGIARIAEGRARIDLGEGKLEIECMSGSLEWVHSGGSQTLAAGERALARDPGELLSVR